MKKTVSTTLSILLSFLCLNSVWAAVNPSDVIGRRISESGYNNSTVKDWSSSSDIKIKEPKCAFVNITGISSLPGPAASYNKSDIYTAKHVNKHAWLEIYDGQGNYMKKPAILNGQGNTSLWWFRYPKQNIAVDFCDSNWNTDNASKFTIGDWVEQDAFHFKANFTEYFRASNSVGYEIWEQVVADRQRPWQKEGVEAETNALCHPMGFPVVVYLNGEFKGVFSWTLKKHRKNMGLDKDKAKHVYIDGMLKESVFWQGNVASSWVDFEVRNPKVLYSDISHTHYGYVCTELEEDNEASKAEISKIGNNYKYITTGKPDYLISYDKAKQLFGDPVPKYIQFTSKKGNKKFCIVEKDKTVFYEYNADSDSQNRILSANTPGYDPKNEDHVQSGKVNASVKALAKSRSTLDAFRNQGYNESKMREEIEKLFDIESLIDYLLFSQVVSNFDGFNSNWQWFTYNGKKWYVAPYDLDCLFGNWNVTTGEFLYSADWSRCNNRNYTLGAKATRGPFYWIQKYYAKDIVARYEQLRAKGVFSADNIANKMKAYYERIGEKYSKAEHDKWDGNANSFGKVLTPNDGWKATYDWRGAFNDNDQSIIGEYNAGRTYYAGNRCTMNYMVWEATKTVTGVRPFKQMGVTDSVDRIRKWATRRIQLLDQDKGVVDPKDSYEIEITSAKMGTVYLPFSFNIPDGLKFYKITGVNGKSITLKEIYKVTEANESYLIMGNKGKYTVKGTYVSSSAEDDFYNESNKKGGNSENLLWGATKNTYVPTGGYVLQNKNGNVAFYRVPKDDYIQIEAYHAYLEIPATGKAPEHDYNFVEDEEDYEEQPSDIQTLTDEAVFVEIEGYYTSSGARVDAPVKGFNIVKYTDGTTHKIFVR